MLQTWAEVKDEAFHAAIRSNKNVTENLSTNSSCSINCCQFINTLRSDNEKVIIPSNLEQHKKQNFRQLIRCLREESDNSGPLLASSEDQVDMADNEGFIVAYRHRKGRKSKSIIRMNEENLSHNSRLPNDIPDPAVTMRDNNLENVPEESVKNVDSAFKFVKVKFPELKESELKNLVQKIERESESSLTDFSNDEIFLKIEDLKERLKDQAVINTKGKQAWSKTPQIHSAKIIDFNECPICYLPWLKDKVILEECGHCFHSECIRLWMKQKKTCPFCDGFSLLLDEFPRLT